ncbi:MAG: Ig-like domain-containing protein, partial [Candidatus Poribacteria bacterium]|nr:Ig-like domain-containing protein [Candidatus Poribacteria bacterium]
KLMDHDSIKDSTFELANLTDQSPPFIFHLQQGITDTDTLLSVTFADDTVNQRTTLSITSSVFSLDSNTAYQIRLVKTSARDTDGNRLMIRPEETVFRFSTRSSVHPTVVSTQPANGAINVTPAIEVEMVFSKLMDHDSIKDSTFELANLTDQSPPFVFHLQQGITDTDTLLSVTFTDDTATEQTILHVASSVFSLDPDTMYQIRLLETTAADTDGNGLILPPDDLVFRFSTGTAPTIVETYPANGSVNVSPEINVRLVFSQLMNQDSIMDSTFELADLSSGQTPFIFNLQDGLDQNTALVNVTFKQENGNGQTILQMTSDFIQLTQDNEYQIRLVETAATNLAGDPLLILPPSNVFRFRTGTLADQITIAPIDNPVLTEGQTLAIKVKAIDRDGDNLLLEISGQPDVISLTDYGHGNGLISGTLGYQDEGVYQISLTATDDSAIAASASRQFKLTVLPAPAVINPIDDQQLHEGDVVSIPLSGADPGGDPVRLSAGGLPPTLQLIDNQDGSGSITGQLGYNDSGAYTVTVFIDNGAIRSQLEFELVVIDAVPPLSQKVLVPIGIAQPIPPLAIDVPQGTSINLPMDIQFGVEVSVVDTQNGSVMAERTFTSTDGELLSTLVADLAPNHSYLIIEDYQGLAIPQAPFELPAYDFDLEPQESTITTDDDTSLIAYQIDIVASLADLMTVIVGDFHGMQRVPDVLPAEVNLPLTAAKKIPAGSPIRFGSGFTLQFDRTIQARPIYPVVFELDLDPGQDGIQDGRDNNPVPVVLNQIVDIDVWVSNVEDLDSYSLDLSFDPMLLRPIGDSIQAGDFLGPKKNTLLMPQVSSGRVGINHSLVGQKAQNTGLGSGRVAALRFQVMADGPIEIQLQETVAFNRMGDRLATIGQSALMASPQLEPSLRLAFEPEQHRFLPGDSIQLHLLADQLVNLDGFDLHFRWDPEILEVAEVLDSLQQGEQPSFLIQNPIDDGRLQISSTMPGRSPMVASDGDDVRLLTIVLTAVKAGRAEFGFERTQLFGLNHRRLNSEDMTVNGKLYVNKAPVLNLQTAGDLGVISQQKSYDNLFQVNVENVDQFGSTKEAYDFSLQVWPAASPGKVESLVDGDQAFGFQLTANSDGAANLAQVDYVGGALPGTYHFSLQVSDRVDNLELDTTLMEETLAVTINASPEFKSQIPRFIGPMLQTESESVLLTLSIDDHQFFNTSGVEHLQFSGHYLPPDRPETETSMINLADNDSLFKLEPVSQNQIDLTFYGSPQVVAGSYLLYLAVEDSVGGGQTLDRTELEVIEVRLMLDPASGGEQVERIQSVDQADQFVTLEVPAEALDTPVDIHVIKAEGGDYPLTEGMLLPAFNFVPTDQSFKQPITVTLPYDPPSLPQGGQIENVGLGKVEVGATQSSWVKIWNSSVDVKNSTVTGLVESLNSQLCAVEMVMINRVPLTVQDEFDTDEDQSLRIPFDDLLGNDIDDDLEPLTVIGVMTDDGQGNLPTQGKVTLDSNQQEIQYTPPLNFFGQQVDGSGDAFFYKITDTSGAEQIGQVLIDVNSINDEPVSADIALEALKNSVRNEVLLTATDVDLNESLTFSIEDGPSFGQLLAGETVVVSDQLELTSADSHGYSRLLHYTPTPDHSGTVIVDSFSYTVTDSSGEQSTSQIQITLINEAPNSQDQMLNVLRNSYQHPVELVATDSDLDERLTFNIDTGPSSGQLFNTAGQLIWQDGQPVETDNGQENLAATIAPIIVQTFPANGATSVSPLVSMSLVFSQKMDHDSVLNSTFELADLTSGYSPFIFDLSAQLTDNPNLAKITLSEDQSGRTVLNMTSDFLQLAEENQYQIRLLETAAKNIDGQPLLLLPSKLSFQFRTGKLEGQIQGNQLYSELFFYTPTPDFIGEDSFSYTVTDSSNTRSTSAVTFNVLEMGVYPVSNPHLGHRQDIHTAHGQIKFHLPAGSRSDISEIHVGIAHEDHQPHRDHLKAEKTLRDLMEDPTYGLHELDPENSEDHKRIFDQIVNHLRRAAGPILKIHIKDSAGNHVIDSENPLRLHLPMTGYVEDATALFIFNTNGSQMLPAIVENGVLVGHIPHLSLVAAMHNNPPVANPQSITEVITDRTGKLITLTGRDDDDDPLTYYIVEKPGQGDVTLSGTEVTYTPYIDQSGSDSFTFRVSDGAAESSPTKVSVTVNYAPEAITQLWEVEQGITLEITLQADDVEGDELSYEYTQPQHGVLSGTAPNLTYVSHVDYSGQDSFTFKANDGTSDSNIASVSIGIAVSPIVRLQQSIPGQTVAFSLASLADLASNIVAIEIPALYGLLQLDLSVVDDTSILPGLFSTRNDIGVALSLDFLAADDSQLTNFSSLPLTVRIPFDPDQDEQTRANAIVLVRDDGAFEFLPTQVVNGNQLEAEIYHLSYVLTLHNQAPEAKNQQVKTDEDTPVEITLEATDAEVDSDDLMYLVDMDSPSKGKLSGTAPHLTYTPNADVNGIDNFTFTVNDGSDDSSATITVNIIPINDAPEFSLSTTLIEVEEDFSATQTVSLTPIVPSDETTQIVTYVLSPDPSTIDLATISFDEAQLQITISALPHQNGTQQLVIDATETDAEGNELPNNTFQQTLTLVVEPVNDAPVAIDQEILNVVPGTDIEVTLSATDVDTDALDLTYTVVDQPQHGILEGETPDLTYTANVGFAGQDSFTFKVDDSADSNNSSNIATVTIGVIDSEVISLQQSEPGEMVAFSLDSFFGLADDGAEIEIAETYGLLQLNLSVIDDTSILPGLFGSRTDIGVALSLDFLAPDDNPLTDFSSAPLIIRLPFDPTKSADTIPNAIVRVRANGEFEFLPTLAVGNNLLQTEVSHLSYVLTLHNHTPVALARSVTATAGSPVGVTLNAEDTDVDSSALTYMVVSDPVKGSLTGTPPNLTYTPNVGQTGSDSFTFKVNDGSLESEVATVNITISAPPVVTPTNSPPVAQGQTITTPEDTEVTITLTGTDAENSSLTYTIVGNPVKGALSGTPPNLIYMPNEGLTGSDSFTFKVNDGSSDSQTATVDITITEVLNNAPIASSQNVELDANSSINIT